MLVLAILGYGAWVAGSGNAYAMRVLSVAGVYAILAIGYQFPFGQAGVLSLVQGSFMGVGAYASALLALRLGLPFDAALPFSVGLPVLLALLLALPTLHLRSHAFALATLTAAQMILLLATEWMSLTGGANGLGGVPGLTVFGMPIRPGWPVLATCWGMAGLSGLLFWWLTRGGLGLAWAVLRERPDTVGSAGLDASRLRLAALVLGAGYAGLAGSLHVHLIRVVSPEALGFPVMVSCLTCVVLGGRGRAAGAAAGAVLVVQLPEWIRGFQDWYLLVYGALLLAVIVAAPEGLHGALRALLRRRLHRPQPVPPPVAVEVAPPRVDAALCEIRGLSCRFGGVRALDGVSLRAEPGRILGLIGPNGSGKTTLLNAVSGYVRPAGGAVLLRGVDATGWPPLAVTRAGVARSFQTPDLPDGVSALDVVALARDPALGGAVRALGGTAGLRHARREAAGLLARLGVLGAASQPCGALPHGVRRRVDIARALALRPRVLLLDEPAAGLTGVEQSFLADRLRELAGEGLGLLVIEHNLDFLLPLADRLACLDRGTLIAEGPPDAVRADPRVREAYLGVPAAPTR